MRRLMSMVGWEKTTATNPREDNQGDVMLAF